MEIKVSGTFALVDKEDASIIQAYTWWLHTEGYAITTVDRKTVYMHRLLNKTPKGYHTDHINGNKLDNRRANLRTATYSENQLNRRNKPRGIYWTVRLRKWEAYYHLNRRKIRVGYFTDKAEAEHRVRIARKEAGIT